jgi:hypothetical protein
MIEDGRKTGNRLAFTKGSPKEEAKKEATMGLLGVS